MVQLYGLLILKNHNLPEATSKPVILAGHIESPWYAFKYRENIRKCSLFFAKLMASKVQALEKRQIAHSDKRGYVECRQNGLTAILVADADYPYRVAFAAVEKVLDDFTDLHLADPRGRATRMLQDPAPLNDFCLSSFNATCKSIIERYQDPTQADDLLMAMRQLEETKLIMGDVLEKMLDRGESLATLMSQADELDDAAVDFYVTVRRRRCCGM